jgi:hypothetical protein
MQNDLFPSTTVGQEHSSMTHRLVGIRGVGAKPSRWLLRPASSPTRNALRAFCVVDNESNLESLSQALSRHSVPFDPSSEMHRRGKVFGFRFVAGGVGEGRS